MATLHELLVSPGVQVRRGAAASRRLPKLHRQGQGMVLPAGYLRDPEVVLLEECNQDGFKLDASSPDLFSSAFPAERTSPCVDLAFLCQRHRVEEGAGHLGDLLRSEQVHRRELDLGVQDRLSSESQPLVLVRADHKHSTLVRDARRVLATGGHHGDLPQEASLVLWYCRHCGYVDLINLLLHGECPLGTVSKCPE